MTGGQTALSLNANSEDSDNDGIESVKKITQKPALKIIHATADNIAREQAIFG
jgi:hypothetical protein